MTTLLGRLGFSQIAVVLGGLHESGARRGAASARHAARRARGVRPRGRRRRRGRPERLPGRCRCCAPTPTISSRCSTGRSACRASCRACCCRCRRSRACRPSTATCCCPRRPRRRSRRGCSATCQGRNVEYGFTSKRGIIPCAAADALEHFATVFFDRVQYFQHTPHARESEAFARVDACGECSLVDSCAGVEQSYLEQFGAAELQAGAARGVDGVEAAPHQQARAVRVSQRLAVQERLAGQSARPAARQRPLQHVVRVLLRRPHRTRHRRSTS